jgi:hypothetical protein
MNQILLSGKPALLTHALPGLLRRWWEEIQSAERAARTRRLEHRSERRLERRRRRLPTQRDRVFEQAAMAREMYRL